MFNKAFFLSGNINKTVSQYQSMNYGCPLGTKLAILSATFGKAPSCPYRDVLAKVLSMCAGKTMNCQVYASTTNFNRSCSGTRKELKTTYKCVRGMGSIIFNLRLSFYVGYRNDQLYKLETVQSHKQDHRKVKPVKLMF